METNPAGTIDPPPRYEPPNAAQYINFTPGQPQVYSSSYGQAVMVQQPQSMAINGSICRYSQYPALIICQHCQATVTTAMNYETGLLTWAIAGLICLFGLWLGCYLIPFCMIATKDVVHSCPNCKNVVGKFHRLCGD